ncbi:MAG: hypothetical protein M1840_001103 [Geoglossum simile]|nr:MAG: hypothetical protein M1840_001103 [Geoglossum simile]
MPTPATTHYAPIGGSPHLDSSASDSPSRVRTPDEGDEDDEEGDGDAENAYELRAFSGKNDNGGSMVGGDDEGVRSGSDSDTTEKEEEGEEEEEEEGKHTRRRHRTSIQGFEFYTPDEERAVVRKFDRRLVTFLAGLYMLSFLDRSSKSSWDFGGIEMAD